MMAHFGDRVAIVEGDWTDYDPDLRENLDEFNRGTAAGRSEQQAAADTWTGRRAGDHGFTQVEIVRALPPRAAGQYRVVLAHFKKPHA
jgi:hypothetical protein